ncbi:MAG: hypothetical protein HOW97_20865 [Catenulispora sp.]|nr:hypothetical protein [Catenulispora sp.]
MSALRARLAVLCEQITRHADMDQIIRDAGVGAQLDELLSAVRDTGAGPDPARLTTLLEEIDDACARHGVVGVTSGSKHLTSQPLLNRYAPLVPGIGGGHSEPPVWVCPLQRCARVVFDDESTTAPLCAAGGNVPMVTKRVL